MRPCLPARPMQRKRDLRRWTMGSLPPSSDFHFHANQREPWIGSCRSPAEPHVSLLFEPRRGLVLLAGAGKSPGKRGAVLEGGMLCAFLLVPMGGYVTLSPDFVWSILSHQDSIFLRFSSAMSSQRFHQLADLLQGQSMKRNELVATAEGPRRT